MGELARRAGVSEGLPYHHFGSKAGALSAVVEDFYDRYDAVLNRDLDPARPWGERERERLLGLIAFLYGEPLAPFVLGRMGRSAQVAGVETVRLDRLIGLARRNIEAGQRGGEIPRAIHAGVAAAAIVGAIHHAVTHAFGDAKRPDPDALGDQLWSLIAGALGLSTEDPSLSSENPPRRKP